MQTQQITYNIPYPKTVKTKAKNKRYKYSMLNTLFLKEILFILVLTPFLIGIAYFITISIALTVNKILI
jgi:hypothetical protein